MKIAFFDGILETHVMDSLQRSFEKLGHQVYSTGKFGHGFEFRVERSFAAEVQKVIEKLQDFKPDWIIVFRPASAPHPVLEALKNTGANLAVWLSDDPVLFQLSYGPIIDRYDVVMHCGNETVLKYYEDVFQRPTGVNIPFWTDHEAFPTVYGANPAETDALFLGNVHDTVRRRRYFSLAHMKNSVRIHGAIGVDYFNISGGYLDSDQEVVDAGSRARVAINIPQFFKDHQGLPTWFPGLDQLGYFEFPSRVIQYASMGLPIISINPDTSPVESMPEMAIAGSVQEADDLITEWMSENRFAGLSAAISERFDKNFSADARALAMLDLFSNDDWKSLDSKERTLWFTQFDGREVSQLSSQNSHSQPISHKSLKASGANMPVVSVLSKGNHADVQLKELGGKSSSDQRNRLIIAENLEKYLVDARKNPATVNISVLLREEKFDLSQKNILMLGRGLTTTASGAKYLRDLGIKTISVEPVPSVYEFISAVENQNHWGIFGDKNNEPYLSLPTLHPKSVNSSVKDITRVLLISDPEQIEESKAYLESMRQLTVSSGIAQEITVRDLESLSTEGLEELVAGSIAVLPIIKNSQGLIYPSLSEKLIQSSLLCTSYRKVGVLEEENHAQHLLKAFDGSEFLRKARRFFSSVKNEGNSYSSLRTSQAQEIILELLAWQPVVTQEADELDSHLAEDENEIVIGKNTALDKYLELDSLGNAALAFVLPQNSGGPLHLTFNVQNKISRSLTLAPGQTINVEFSALPPRNPGVTVSASSAEFRTAAYANIESTYVVKFSVQDPTRVIGVQVKNAPRISISPM